MATTSSSKRQLVHTSNTYQSNSDLTVGGDLFVNGSTTTIDTANLLVEDKNILIGNVSSPSDTTADGGGITLKGGEDYTINWTNSTNSWHFNQGITVGENDAGHDVKFFGDTASRYMLWDSSDDSLKLPDNVRLKAGTNNDLHFYHNSTNNISFIENHNANGLRIKSDELLIFALNGSTLRAEFDTAVKLLYNDAYKFQTTNLGVTVTGKMTSDTIATGYANSLEMFSSGTNNFISSESSGSHLFIRNVGGGNTIIQGTTNENAIVVVPNGAVTLYHDNATRLSTTTDGISLSGNGYVDFPDNGRARFGGGFDLAIYHSGIDNNNYIDSLNGRNLMITSNGISLKSAGGENMITATANGAVALHYDAASHLQTTQTGVNVTGKMVSDSITTGSDLEIFTSGGHNYISSQSSGSNLYIRNTTGGQILIRPKTGEEGIKLIPDGAVQLYHNNALKLSTASAGVSITGGLNVSTLSTSSSNRVLVWDTSSDVRYKDISTADQIYNGDITFNGTTAESDNHGTRFSSTNYVQFAGQPMSRLYGNECLWVDLHGSVSTSGTITNPNNVFRTGDTYNQFSSTTGTNNPIVYTIDKIFSSTSAVNNRRICIFAHIGFTCDLKIEVKNSSGNYETVFDESHTFGTARWSFFRHDPEISYPADWSIQGLRFTFDNYGTTTRYIGQIGITNIRNHNTFPYIARGGGNLYDNSVLSFGNGQDLKIFHNGSNSFIQDNGDGGLILEGSTLLELKARSGEVYFRGTENGSVKLYHDNAGKFETTSTGATVTGRLTASEVAVSNIVTNKIVKFNGTLLDDSILSDNGSTVTVGGDLDISAGNIELDTAYAIQWGGTANRIWGSGGNNYIKIETNGVERLRVDGQGDVGIGFTNPSKKLHVNGDIKLKNSGKLFLWNDNDNNYLDYQNWIASTGNAQLIRNTGAGGIKLKSTSLEVVVTSGLGIGVTSPESKVHIQNTVAAGSDNLALHLQNPTTDSDSRVGMMFRVNNNTGSSIDGAYIQAINNGVDGRAHLSIGSVLNGSLDEHVRIDSVGKVGIGKDPSTDLDVVGRFHVTGHSTSQVNVAKITKSHTSGSNNTYTFEVDSSSHTSNMTSAGAMAVDVNSGRAFTINGLGRVGIGTTNPAVNLHVESSSSAQFKVGNGTQFVRLYADADEATILADGSVDMRFYTAGSEKMRLDTDGNVGIGTTSPQEKLQVNGYVRTKNSKYKKYTSLSGSSNDWFPIYQVNDHKGGQVTFNVNTYAHSSCTFVVSEGYGPSGQSGNPAHINVLNYLYHPNGGYANITGIRVNQIGMVEIKLTFTSGPSVSVAVRIESSEELQNSLASSLATSTSTEAIRDTVILSNRYARFKNLTLGSDGTVSLPALNFGSSGSTGLYYTSSQLNFALHGSTRMYLTSAGIFSSGNLYSGATGHFRNVAGTWKATTGTANKGWEFLNTAGSPSNTVPSATLSSTGTLVLNGKTTSTKFELYETFTDTSNFERATFDFSGGYFNIDTNKSGTGHTASGIKLGANGYPFLQIEPEGNVLINGANDNSNRADFAVGTLGNPRVSWHGNQVQIGGTDMNYNGNISYNSAVFRMQSWQSNISFELKGTSGTANKDIIFRPFNGTADTEAMRIKGDGKLGIGTQNPDRHVVIDAGSGYPLKVNSTQDYMIGLSRSGTEQWWLKAYNNGDFAIHENGVGDQLHIDAGGKVGLGTSSPAHKLDVVGTYRISDNTTNANNKLHRMLGRHYTNAEQDVNIFSSVSTSSTNFISFGGGSSSYNTATHIVFYTASNNTSTYAVGQERLRIHNNGNIGIAVGSPQQKLDVDGLIKQKVYTATSLPSPSSATRGARAFVSDSATAYNSSSVGSAIGSGGGSNFVPVYSDGSSWRIG